MVDLLKKGSDWLAEKQTAFAATPITYRRGELSVTLDATIGATLFEQQPIDGIAASQSTESRDFLVLAADLDFGSGSVTPRSGDRITQTDDAGVDHEYVVAPLGFGGFESAWRWSDMFHRRLRIHAKSWKSSAP